MGILDQLRWLRTEDEVTEHGCETSADALQNAARDISAISQEIVDDAAARKALERMKLINSLGLDEQRDEFLTHATSVVCASLNTPVSMVNLVGEDTQFTVAAVGDVPPNLPISYSTCRFVVETEAPFAFSDADHDERVKDLPQVNELGVKAYLGVPIVMQSGIIVGSVCAIDRKPHEWSTQDKRVLRSVSDMVTLLLEMKREVHILQEERQAETIRKIAQAYKDKKDSEERDKDN